MLYLTTKYLRGFPRLLLVVLLFYFNISQSYSQKTHFVNTAATGNADGSSWKDAFVDLTIALQMASMGDQVWVAKGTYSPGMTMESTFLLKSGVKLYGGFSGTESSLSQRSKDNENLFAIHETILTGSNINYHVVTVASGASIETFLDGFTIRDGAAVIGTTSTAIHYGGGIYHVSGSAVLRNLLLKHNKGGRGGGAYIAGNPRLENIIFEHNEANLGGGLHVVGPASLSNLIFRNNKALTQGGGLYNTSSPSLENLVFIENESQNAGGGFFTGGIISLYNAVFSQNRVLGNFTGGGMFTNGTATISNVTFSNNSTASTHATIFGGGGLSGNATTNVSNSIFWGNTSANGLGNQVAGAVAMERSIVQGGYDGGSEIIDMDPLFIQASSDNLRLRGNSIAIDAGINTRNPTQFDLDGNPRIVNGMVDLGAYEASTFTGIRITNLNLPIVKRNQPYTNTLIAEGGNGNYTWSIRAPGLPQGLILDSATGQITGSTAEKSGVYQLLVEVSDGVTTGTKQLYLQIAGAPIRMYVNPAANLGANNGSSWSDGFIRLQSALANAENGDEIWVARGTYSPGSLATDAFRMVSGVQVYGGFSGTETHVHQRTADENGMYTANASILEGNNINYHVISNNIPLSNNTILDGFTIRGGRATAPEPDGGGIFNSISTINAIFRNLIVQNNQSSGLGAGIFNTGIATFENILVRTNTAGSNGGGIFNNRAGAVFNNINAINNKANNGGGMSNSANISFTNGYFDGNEATLAGGGLHNTVGTFTDLTFINNRAGTTGGGINNTSTATFDRIKIIENTSFQHGGGMFNSGLATTSNALLSGNVVESTGQHYGGGLYNTTSNHTLRNVTFSNNRISRTAAGGGAIFRAGGTVNMSNSIIWGNTRSGGVADQLSGTITVTYSIVEGGFTGIGNKSENPLFVNALIHDIRLKSGSPAINAGLNTNVNTLFDLDGNVRIINETVDMGAYEFQTDNLTITSVTLRSAVRGTNFEYQFSASGGLGIYTWSIISGELPKGLILSDQGILSGYPLGPVDLYSFEVGVTDGTNNGKRSFTLRTQTGKARIYVKESATGQKTGSSWEHAFKSLKEALDQSLFGDEIWTGKGTYSPGNTVLDAFILKDGVKIYGGFAGVETDLQQRIADSEGLYRINESILDGKGVNYHVVFNDANISNFTELNGFTVTGGKTMETSTANHNHYGGGIFNISGSPVFSHLWIKNNIAARGGGMYNTGNIFLNQIIFQNNSATTNQGGGIWNTGSSSLSFVKFINNTSLTFGGGMNSTGSIDLKEVVFSGNRAGSYGGGLVSSGGANLQDVTFIQNIAGGTGGGMDNRTAGTTLNRVAFINNRAVQHGGGLHNNNSINLENVVFSRNQVTSTSTFYGGGMYSSGTSNLVNTTFSKNTVARPVEGSGGGFYSTNTNSAISNSIFWENTNGSQLDQINSGSAVDHSTVQNGYPGGTRILIADPLFENSANDDFKLKAGSLAIDAGDNRKVSADLDFLKKPRIIGTVVDMGAYENQKGGLSLDLNPKLISKQVRGQAVNIVFEASGSETQIVYDISSGNLPLGLTLNRETGVLSGVPTVAGSYTIVVSATDGDLIGSRQYKWEVTPGANRFFVDQSATGNRLGISWANAFLNLQTAIAQALPGDEIWVAKGNYSPGTGTGDSFVLKEGVKLYGGFAGTELELQNRILSDKGLFTANETILDGKGINYHVIFNSLALSTATEVNGFTITGGKTLTGSTGETYYGGGIYNLLGAVIFRNLWIKNNEAARGGGMYNSGPASFNQVIFENNKTTSSYGGGVWNTGSVTFERVSFLNNYSFTTGGGIYNSASIILNEIIFSGNTSLNNGGGMWNNGAVTMDRVAFINNSSTTNGGGLYSTGTATISNSIFSRNKVTGTGAHYGGGMWFNTGTAKLVNVTFSQNAVARTGADSGGGLFMSGGIIEIVNSIFWNNFRGGGEKDQIRGTPTISFSIVEDGFAGINNLVADPLFENPSQDNLKLRLGSLAIDKGYNEVLDKQFDYVGNPRIVNDIVDLGAFEKQGGVSLEITPVQIPGMVRGSQVEIGLAAGAGVTNLEWSVLSGDLPIGLRLSADGNISGRPMVEGSYTFVLMATNEEQVGSRQYTVVVQNGNTNLLVWASAKGDNSGSDWKNAIPDIKEALRQSVSGDEIWVGEGVYLPGPTATDYFVLKEGIKLYGGFAGVEGEISERVSDTDGLFTVHPSVLDGKGINRHVVYNDMALSNATLIDGFTITRGRTLTTNSTTGIGPAYYGGGIYNATGEAVFSNLLVKENIGMYGGGMFNTGNITLSNVHFLSNQATGSIGKGAGLYNTGSIQIFKGTIMANYMAVSNASLLGAGIYNSGQINLTEVNIRNNNVGIGNGGGIYTTGASSALKITQSTLENNQAGFGGGLFINSGIHEIIDVVFLKNLVVSSGGGAYTRGTTIMARVSFVDNLAGTNGGGLHHNAGTITVLNTIFSRNKVSLNTSSGQGAGLYHNGGVSNIINVTFSNNQTTFSHASTSTGSGLFFRNLGSLNIHNSIFWGNRRGGGVLDQLFGNVVITHSLVQEGYNNDEEILQADPLFEDAVNDNLRLKNSSPAIDAGDGGKQAGLFDRDGNPRISNGAVDMGAYENFSGVEIIVIQPETITDLTRGSPFQLILSAEGITPADGGSVWTVQQGALPVGLRLSADGVMSGNPTLTGIYTFVLSVNNGEKSGSRQYTVEVLSGNTSLFVWGQATGDRSGSDFTNGMTSLQEALRQAIAGDLIFVAKGEYSPGDLVTSTFSLKENVKIYGGFAGTERSLEERDINNLELNETILDGSKGVASRHVVTNLLPLTSATVLDGFTIIGGQTLLGTTVGANYSGGGIYNQAGSCIFSNLVIRNNAAGRGAGVWNGGNATFSNITFTSNTATYGGGFFNENASPVLTDVIFKNNTGSNFAGGMHHSSGNAVLNRVSFIGNSSVNHGGGLRMASGNLQLENVLFSKNQVTSTSANYGGGMYVGAGVASLTNVTFAFNKVARTTVNSGGGLFATTSSSVNVANSIFWGNTRGGNVLDQVNDGMTISYSIVQGGYASGSVILQGDPGFTMPDQDIYALKGGSPAIDAGDNSRVVGKLDIQGNTRIFNDIVDIGAYENQGGVSLNINVELLGPFKRGEVMDFSLTVEGGTGQYTWSLQAGALPIGMVLTPEGILKSTPMVVGTYTFVVSVTDGDIFGSKQFTVEVQSGSTRIYVAQNAVGTKNGSRWQDAFIDLQIALAQAETGDEIWVGKGNYSPGITGTSYFNLIEGVKIFGGFAGTESSLEERRIDLIHTANRSVMDGSQGTASRHVVYNIAPLTNETILDGFTISGGKTLLNGTGANYYGGGIYNSAGSPVFRNLIITGNNGVYGGGMFNSGSPYLSHVVFSNNIALGTSARGAGLYSNAPIHLHQVTFESNTIAANSTSSRFGAGMFNTGFVQMDSVYFLNNKVEGSTAHGGGLYSTNAEIIIRVGSFKGNHATSGGGAMYINSGSLVLTDVDFRLNNSLTAGAVLQNAGTMSGNRLSFIGNQATQHGGAIRSRGELRLYNSVFSNNQVTNTGSYYGGAAYVGGGTATFTNVSLSKNRIARISTTSLGGAIYRGSGTVNIYNSILWGNTRGSGVADQLGGGISFFDLSNSVVEGGFETGNNLIFGDPLFEGANADNLRLRNGSLAIDKGDNGYQFFETDLVGNERVINGIIDIGAYENDGGEKLNILPEDMDTFYRGNAPMLQLNIEGASGKVSYAVETGLLPTGLTLSPDGLLEGTPTIVGTYEFVISASTAEMAGNRQYKVEVLPSPTILFVNKNAKGNNDGNDWANALNSLQEAIDQSYAGDQIWVAKGTYSPGLTANSHFVLKEGVKIYGGFAGVEAKLEDREIALLHTTNQTVLDGSEGTASRHVVYNNSELTSETILDGFTVSGGRTLTGSTGVNYYGAGIYNRIGSPIFRNLLITDNSGAYGGGMFNSGTPVLQNIIFRNNTATGINGRGAGLYSNGRIILKGVTFEKNEIPASSTRVLYGAGMFNAGAAELDSVFFINNRIFGNAGQGGGLYNTTSASLKIRKGEFLDNQTAFGGAMYLNSGSVELQDLLFKDNKSTTSGGGIFQQAGNLKIERLGFIQNNAVQHGGAIRSGGTVEISNSIFSRNSVSSSGTYYGGAIYVASGAATVINSSFSQNRITRMSATIAGGGAIYRGGGNILIQNSILWGNRRGGGIQDQVGGTISNVQISHSIVEGGYGSGSFIMDVNPLFLEADAHNLMVSACSPGIDTGDNGKRGSGTLDYLGNLRLINNTVDLGAFEYQENGQLLEISTVELPQGNRGSYYEQQLTVKNSPGKGSWQLISGNLPDGLSLSDDGLIQGNPIVNGLFEFVVNVNDVDFCGNRNLAINIIPGEGVVQIYVNQAAKGGQNNGSNWTNAYLSLQRALEVSVAGDEIWVAKGSYSPGVTEKDFFILKDGVRMYGGFSGIEEYLDQRDLLALHTDNRTVLDGSMEGMPAYHVLYNVSPLTTATIVDGFVISGGKSLNTNSINGKGAGFYNNNGSPLLRNLIFENNYGFQGAGMYTLGATAQPEIYKVLFKNNTTSSHGAALYIAAGTPKLIDVIFDKNTAEGISFGGAIYNAANTVFTVDKGSFVQNKANRGGAIYLATGAPVLTDVVFEKNHASVHAGGLFAIGRPILNEVKFLSNTANRHAGALWSQGTVTIQNGLFAQNEVLENGAYYGGAIYNNSGTLNLIQATLAENSIAHVNAHATAFYGGAVFRRTGTVNIINSILWGNLRGNRVPDQVNANINLISNTLIEGGFEKGTTIVESDPMFVKSSLYDYNLQACSPAINMGDNSKANHITIDIDGKKRIYGTAVDLGIYESHQEQLTLQPAALPEAIRGAPYEVQLGIEGAIGTNYEIFYNQLPDGLTLSTEGKIGGKTLAVGKYTFGIKATDGDKCGNGIFTINVLPGEGGARIYVNQSAPSQGQNNGSDWNNAYIELNSALRVAMAGDSIWVAKGTYSPGTRATSYFVPVEGVKMYGGFSGVENLIGERDSLGIHTTNVTILDGSRGAGSRHVLYNTFALTPATVIDGFVISGGKTSSTNNIHGRGAGFYNGNGSPILSHLIFRDNDGFQGGGMYTVGVQAKPSLRHVIFEDNRSAQHGGGLHIASGQPEFNEVLFSKNKVASTYNGGGLFSSSSLPILMTKVSFVENEAYRGGGFYNSVGSPVLEEVLFERNHARFNAGGMYALGNPTFKRAKFIANTSIRHAGGLWSQGNISLENSVFSRNRVTTVGNFYGGGIYHVNGTLHLSQVSFSQNHISRNSAGGGAAIYRASGNVLINNTILYNNTHGNGQPDQIGGTTANIKITNSIVQSGYPTGVKILDLDPEFINPSQDDLSLSSCSPAINMGDNAQAKGTSDILGYNRIMHQLVDLGAYEFQGNFLDAEPLKLPEGVQWENYNFQIQLEEGRIYQFSLGFGLLPDGMVLSEDGIVSGEPLVFGDFEFNVNVKSAEQCGLLHIKISIRPEDPYIIEILNPFPEPISRYLGTAFANLELPDSVEVILSDKTRSYFNVKWQEGNYNPEVIGLYKLIGVVDASEKVNRENLFPEIKVAVVEPLIPYIANVSDLAPVYVLSGSAFDGLVESLPRRVEVTVKIDTVDSETLVFKDELEVIWKQGKYLPHYGTYRIFGELVLDSNLLAYEFALTNPAEFEAMLDVHVQRNIVSAQILPDLIVDLHTPSYALDLVKTVRVTYHDGSTGLLDVKWNTQDYTGNLGGAYDIWGDFVLSPLISNLEGIKAMTSVIIQKEITSVSPDPAVDLKVPYGTGFGDIIGLPENVMVHFNDGSTEILDVNWLAADYDEEKPGLYLLLGELLHGDLIVPTEDVFAKARIKVLPIPKYIIEVLPIDSIYVNHGTDVSTINQLNDLIKVRYDDDSIGALPVLWDTFLYEPNRVGAYEIYGELIMPEDNSIVNELELEAYTILAVRLKQIISFTSPDTIKLDFGTDKLNLDLNETIPVTYIDGSQGEESVEWESTTYDGYQEGIFRFVGNWILEDETIVNEGLEQPILWLSVGPKPLEIILVDSIYISVDILTPFESAITLFPSEVGVKFDNGSSDVLEVIWHEKDFNSEEPGLQYVVGEVILTDGVINPSDLIAVIVVEIGKHKILSIDSLAPLEVSFGEVFQELSLPNTVISLISNGDQIAVEVVWEVGDYDAEKAGEYTLIGSLKLTEDIINPLGLHAALRIIVLAKVYDISSVDELDTLQVPLKTAFNTIKGFPEQVQFILDDGSEIKLAISQWKSETYESNVPGIYQAYGDIVLAPNVQNAYNIIPTISIQVLERYLVEVQTLDTVHISFGSTWEEIPFPMEMLGTYSDGSLGDVSVEWMFNEDFNSQVSGTYAFMGDLIVESEEENRNYLVPEVIVKVQEKPLSIVSLQDLSLIEVTFGTTLNAVLELLPNRIKAYLNNETEVSVDVIWDALIFDGEVIGSNTFIGTLAFEENSLFNNPEELEAIQVVQVNPISVFKVENLMPIIRPAGKSFVDLDLPLTIKVELSNEQNVELEINWKMEEYDSLFHGQQVLQGDLVMTNFLANPENLTASISLTLWKDIVSIASIDTISTLHGTLFDQLGLPEFTIAELTDGTTKMLSIDWEEAKLMLSESPLGYVLLQGALKILNEEIFNSHNITADVWVELKDPYVKVVFDTDGGNNISYQMVKISELLNRPPNPLKAGFAFEGWYEDAGKTVYFDFTQSIESEMTLYGQWMLPSLPDQGALSMKTIAAYMVKIGEMLPASVEKTYSLAQLNSLSHLPKTAPFKISDWYSYGEIQLPKVKTILVSNISSEVWIKGIILSDGSGGIQETGICWSKYPIPTTADNKVISSEKSDFELKLEAFQSGIYYIRTYAEGLKGTGYGNTIKIQNE